MSGVGRVVVLASELNGVLASAVQQVSAARAAGGPSAVVLLFELDQSGPMRPTQVARLLGLTTGGATKLVDRLARLGCVERVSATVGDRRAVDVVITTEGRTVARAAREAVLSQIGTVQDLVGQMYRLLPPRE